VNELPTPTLDPVDPTSREAWIKELRVGLGDEEAFGALDSVVGQLGRLSVDLAAKLKAKGRGQRGGGSEAFDPQHLAASLAQQRDEESPCVRSRSARRPWWRWGALFRSPPPG
jgi:hypothetical protein